MGKSQKGWMLDAIQVLKNAPFVASSDWRDAKHQFIVTTKFQNGKSFRWEVAHTPKNEGNARDNTMKQILKSLKAEGFDRKEIYKKGYFSIQLTAGTQGLNISALAELIDEVGRKRAARNAKRRAHYCALKIDPGSREKRS